MSPATPITVAPAPPIKVALAPPTTVALAPSTLVVLPPVSPLTSVDPMTTLAWPTHVSPLFQEEMVIFDY